MSHAFLFTGPPARALERGDRLRRRASVRAGPARLRRLPRVPHRAGRVARRRGGDPHRGLSIGIKQVRDLVRRSALSPIGNRWQIVIVEDADRLTEQAFNALLKAIEEPTERTVWMLCAPTVEDVLPTIRSRCRLVSLTTPTAEEVAAFLVRREGVDTALASYAARASQGHIGRARALARDERRATGGGRSSRSRRP